MTRKKVFTYKKNDLRQYIYQREEEEAISVITLAQIEKNGLDYYLSNEDSYLDLDLTSTIKLIINGMKLSNYGIESIIESFDNYGNVSFIVEEIYEQDLLSELPYFFGSSIPLEINTDEVSLGNEIIVGGVGEKRTIVDLCDAERKSLLEKIELELIGHKDLKCDIKDKINEFYFLNEKLQDQPIISLFLLGASGLGKTELARIIHSYLDEKTPLAKINFANYTNESSLASLIGSPPGYLGSGEESDLIKKIKSSSTGVLLVDEFEKADPSVRNFFLQLLEEGKFDDALGNIYDLSGYLIIFTSNLNKEDYLKDIPAELRSRFNGVYLMKELTYSEKNEYANTMISWYFKKSGERITEDKISRILKKVNLKKESNLRTIKFRLRSAFYIVNYSSN